MASHAKPATSSGTIPLWVFKNREKEDTDIIFVIFLYFFFYLCRPTTNSLSLTWMTLSPLSPFDPIFNCFLNFWSLFFFTLKLPLKSWRLQNRKKTKKNQVSREKKSTALRYYKKGRRKLPIVYIHRVVYSPTCRCSFPHFFYLHFSPWKTCNKAINSCCPFPDVRWKELPKQKTQETIFVFQLHRQFFFLINFLKICFAFFSFEKFIPSTNLLRAFKLMNCV